MATKKKMLQAAAGSAGGGGGFTAIEDVFSTYLYTGNGSTQTITNGIDLAGEGGLVWIKDRTVANDHVLFNTASGPNFMQRLLVDAQESVGSDVFQSFNSDGFTHGFWTGVGAVRPYASWTFRKAPRFFDVVTYTGTGSARTVSHNLGTTVGSIIIKRTDTTSNWAVYHRGNTAAPETDFLSLNLTNATADDATYWNDTAPTDSVFTVGTNAAVNASGGTYVAYLYAHDPLGPSEDGSDGLIACGSYNGSSADFEVDLGWEPQWLMIKKSAGDFASGWAVFDNMRGVATGGSENTLLANSSVNENGSGIGSNNFVDFTSTGFALTTNFGLTNDDFTDFGGQYIYIAIRRGPMRAPESGTEVFATDSWGGTAPTPPTFVSGFPVDFSFYKSLENSENNWNSQNRMTGSGDLAFNVTSAEFSNAGTIWNKDYMGGIGNNTAVFSGTQMWMFRRAPSFFDVVAYTGDGVAGRTVPHNLGVAPEMIIIKRRDGDDSNPHWYVYHAATGAGKMLLLNLSEAAAINTVFWETPSTDEVFDADRNTSGQTYIAYLFATLVGVSKVGSYTGNGSSQTINCGFTTGARLVLIKATSTTGDWLIADTARGIVAGNDPYLELNTTNAEVTSEDWLDPDSSGFVVNEVAGSNANTSGVSYIFYAIA